MATTQPPGHAPRGVLIAFGLICSAVTLLFDGQFGWSAFKQLYATLLATPRRR